MCKSLHLLVLCALLLWSRSIKINTVTLDPLRIGDDSKKFDVTTVEGTAPYTYDFFVEDLDKANPAFNLVMSTLAAN